MPLTLFILEVRRDGLLGFRPGSHFCRMTVAWSEQDFSIRFAAEDLLELRVFSAYARP